MSSTFKLLSTVLLVSIFTRDARASDGVPCMLEQPPIPDGWGSTTVKKPVVAMGGWGAPVAAAVKPPAATKGGWGTITASVNKKPVVAMGGWGAPAAVNLGADELVYKTATHDVFAKATHKAVPVGANILAADELAYKAATQGIFPRATHEAALSTELAQLKVSHATFTPINFSLVGALGFAEVIKAAHANISAYLTTGKNLTDSLAAGEGAPWSEDATVALVAALNVAGIVETLSDGATAISTLSDAQVFTMLDGADSADKSALIAGLQAEAARIDTAAGNNDGTDALEALVTNLQIRAFLKRVG